MVPAYACMVDVEMNANSVVAVVFARSVVAAKFAEHGKLRQCCKPCGGSKIWLNTDCEINHA